MNRRAILLIPLLILPATAQEDAAEDNPAPDLMRFSSGDQLEGSFGGVSAEGRVRWLREDVTEPMEFRTGKIRQIVLQSGHRSFDDLDASHVALVNGDRLPGRVASFDGDNLRFDTPVAGLLEIERSKVATLAPNPFGGRLLYSGPYATEGWEVHRAERDNPQERKDEDPADDEEAGKGEEAEEAEDPPSWVHTGSAWYYREGHDGLRLDPDLPDVALLRFHAAWRNRPPLNVAFHADFAKPEFPEPEDGDDEPRRFSSRNLADVFGNAYVLSIHSSYTQLQKCGFDEDGDPFLDRIRAPTTNLRLNNRNEAEFEIRCNRRTGVIALFVDGEFAIQWNVRDPLAGEEADDYAGKGGGIGFHVMGSDKVRISNVIIAEWNGMPDSARSMEVDAADVILMTNGTDRFSGTLTSIESGIARLKGKYADLRIPVEEIAEIHFARNGRREVEETLEERVAVHFQPVGRLTGSLGPTGDDGLTFQSKLAGQLKLDLKSAVFINFQSTASFLNFWDEEL